MDTRYSHWSKRWDDLAIASKQHVATGRWLEGSVMQPRFFVCPSAREEEVLDVESRLRIRLPRSFRDVILNYSAEVDIEWQLPDGGEHTGEFSKIYAGECRWSLESLPDLVESHQILIDSAFTDPTDDYDRVWWNKLPFLKVGNGDMVAIDTAIEGAEPVVYLSHEDGPGHGVWLGSSFADYIERLSLIGCPGAEDWQWIPFVDGPRSLLLPSSPKGLAWRE